MELLQNALISSPEKCLLREKNDIQSFQKCNIGSLWLPKSKFHEYDLVLLFSISQSDNYFRLISKLLIMANEARMKN